MRHRVAGKKLSRNTSQRKALFKSLINALVLHGQINTTESKAKVIRRLVDKLISHGKKGTLNARRIIHAFLQNRKAVEKIVNDIGPRFKAQAGGFTRVTRLFRRKGDGATLMRIELTKKADQPANVSSVPDQKKTDKKQAVQPKTKPNRQVNK